MQEIIEAANTLWEIHYTIKTCQICKTQETCLWRKNIIHKSLCNRCGLKVAKAVKDMNKV